MLYYFKKCTHTHTHTHTHCFPLPPKALRSDKDKQSARHEEDAQETNDRHTKDLLEIGAYIQILEQSL